jgi:hypothetical protein
MLFESQPLLFVGMIVGIVEIWLRVRRPLFTALARLFARRIGPL